MNDVVDLLAELVRTPSPSGGEAAAAERLRAWLAARGVAVEVDDAAVRAVVPGGRSGPTLLLASHLDTVPPGEGWTVDPHGAVRRGERLYGRGAVDAKASVAAMAGAAAALAAEGGPAAGRLVVLATYCEETRDTTMPEALRRLGGAPDFAVVGEPTSLHPSIAQRGLLALRVRWRGEQAHAGWAAGRRNAVVEAARGIVALAEADLGAVHPLLGPVTATPTVAEAGVARNVTPPECAVFLDVRTTPATPHPEVVERVRAAVAPSGGEVEVVSDRLRPVETPPGSELLARVRALRPEGRPFGSPTCSDWVWLAGVDAVKLGPGDSRRSHTPDEWVDVGEVVDAARLYADLARALLA